MKKYKLQLLSISIILVFAFSPLAAADGLAPSQSSMSTMDSDLSEYPDNFSNQLTPNQASTEILNDSSAYPTDFDAGSFLSDHQNSYNQKWDPWKTKAAIHTVATSDDGEFFALGGGYLYDNQIHLYRWNPETEEYSLVWEVGGDVFESDVMAIDFADTDHNNLTEIIAGTKAGFVYVFEQTHIYDPNTNMENQFELVWESERMGRVFDLMVKDTDGDYKKDIIVGTANTIRHYEYDDHGGYPFSDEHWIEFEEVFSYEVDSFITSLGVVDANSNGLPEVAVGQQSGKIELLENNGTILDVDGEPYPLLQDDSYVPVWDSGNTIRRAVSDMTGGDLDNDNVRELVVAAQGQGAFVLDTFNDQIGVYKLHRDFDSWETSGGSPYTLDYQLDFISNTSSLKSGQDGNYTYYSDFNVYFHNSTDNYPEPLDDEAGNNPQIYPFRSAAVDEKDSLITYFNGDKTSRNAWGIFDWGKDEEASSNGITTLHDLELITEDTSVATSDFSLSVSENGFDYYPIDSSQITTDSGKYVVEVDPTLEQAGLNYYRYLKINVSSGILKVDAVNTKYVNNRLFDALSTEVGSLTFKNDVQPTVTGFIGTIDGTILGITHNSGEYRITWDSYKDERYKVKKNLFDLELIKKSGNFPALIKNELSYELDLNQDPLPDNYGIVDYAAANLMGIEDGKSQELLVTSSYGNIFVYTQDSLSGTPTADPDARETLLGPYKDIYNQSSSSAYDYIGVSLIPTDFMYYESTTDTLIDPSIHPYILMVSKWNGSMGLLDLNDQMVGAPSFDMYYLDTNDGPSFKPLPNYDVLNLFERSGQHTNIMDASTWIPKIQSADMIGDKTNDLIMTNGRIHLMESAHTNLDTYELGLDATVSNRELIENGILEDKMVTQLNYYHTPNYFDEINNLADGRHWTNANPVNFDGDDDIDIVLGFARYSDSYFGFNKADFGITYWENQGTSEQPDWVENRKAITNIDPDSSFRSQEYSDPYFLYENYDFGEMQISELGYHPLYRTDKPSKLLMFNVDNPTQIFSGAIESFQTEYTHQQSLLAATYPEVKRIDINLKYNDDPSNTAINYGLHVFETWDNSEKLRDWTLSMDTGDLDQDGKNEVIIGDFDNNLYVFEHLTNNTFKRAFESTDINRTVIDNETPYAYEDLNGISGEFQRTIFQHVRYLTTGSDLNSNGRQEIVAATDNMIFIFESSQTPTGQIRDDSFSLVKIIDLYSEQALGSLDTEEIEVSTIMTGDDLTNDGRGEIIVAVQGALLIYEMSSSFATEEIFQDAGFSLPGSLNSHPSYTINAIHTGDLDQDGLFDLTYAGANGAGAEAIRSGFISIIEWTGSKFVLISETSEYPTLSEFNPVSSLAVSDSDLDDNKELAIGHDKGVEIYEFTGDNQVAYRESISSNPVFPYPENFHYADDITSDEMKPEFDIARDPTTNTLTMVYYALEEDLKAQERIPKLKMATSTDNGQSWTVGGRVYFTPTSESSGELLRYESIDLNYDDSVLWLTFVGRHDSNSGDNLNLYVIRDPDPDKLTSNQVAFHIITDNDDKDKTTGLSPSLYEIYGNTHPNETGIAFNYNQTGYPSIALVRANITNNRNYYNYDTNEGMILPFANGSNNDNHYWSQGLDITQLHDQNGAKTPRYGLTFTGYRYDEKLSVDNDVYYTELNLSNVDNMTFNVSKPTRTFESGRVAINPTIIQDEFSGARVIGYSQDSSSIAGGIQAVWSRTGVSWNGPYDILHPLGDRDYNSVSTGENYLSLDSEGLSFLDRLTSVNPVLVSGQNQGFYLANNQYLNVNGRYELGICDGRVNEDTGTSQGIFITMRYPALDCNPGNQWTVSLLHNPWSNFTRVESVNSVQDIATGDSDRDGRQEILIASGNDATLVEFISNRHDIITHNQKWISPSYNRDITSVAIFDANGNDYPELLIESSEGVVNSFEVINPSPIADLLYPAKDAEITVTTDTFSNDVMEIITNDINDDGTEDFFYTTRLGQLVAIDGNTLQPIWSPAISGMGADVSSSSNQLFNDHVSLITNQNTGENEYIALVHRSNISLFDLSDGSLVVDREFNGELISSMEVGNFSTGTYEDIVISLQNGSLLALGGNDLSINENTYYAPASISGNYVTDIQTGQFTGTDHDLIFTTADGYFIVYDSLPGSSVIWNSSVPVESLQFTYAASALGYSSDNGIAITDLNDDNLDDVVLTGNATFALDINSQSQLWNSTNLHEYTERVTKQPVLRDLNGDGVQDIIQSTMFARLGTPDEVSIIAYDGKNGQLLWDYSSRTEGANQLNYDIVEGEVETETNDEVLLTSHYGYYIYGGYLFPPYDVGAESLISILDPNGVARGGIPSPDNVILGGMTTANLSYENPVILFGNEYGTVSVYTLWDGQQQESQTTVTTPGESANINLDQDITGFDGFNTTSGFISTDITGTSSDELIVIENGNIIAYDVSELATGDSDPVVYHTTVNLGGYLNTYLIDDVNGNGQQDLLLGFELGLLLLDHDTGSIIWTNTDVSEESSSTITPEFFNLDFNTITISGTDYLFVTFGLIFGDTTYRGFRYLYASSGSIASNFESPSMQSIYQETGDFIGDGSEQLIYMYTYANKYHQFVMGHENGSTLYNAPWVGLGPISSLDKGQFDTTIPGMEILIGYDLNRIDEDTGIDLSSEPTKFLTLSYQEASTEHDRLQLTNSATFLGLSANQGSLRDYHLLDMDTDGDTDIVSEASDGSLSSIEVGSTSDAVYNQVGTHTDLLNPQNMIDKSVTGNFCGTSSIATTINVDTVRCYDSTNLDQASVNWETTIDVRSILTLVDGNFDGDGTNDIAVISHSGEMYLITSQSLTSLAVQKVDIDHQTSISDLVWENPVMATFVGLISLIMAIPATRSIVRKYKLKVLKID